MSADPTKKLLVAFCAVLAVATICLSIAVARTSGSSSKTTVVNDIEKTVTTLPVKPPPAGDNYCAGTKVPLDNVDCYITAINGDGGDVTKTVDTKAFGLGTPEQAGGNVTKGYIGGLNVATVPFTDPYFMEGMCPVNVHWHLGTEHLSIGEYDENGKGPSGDHDHRSLAGDARLGLRCHHYDASKPKFTKEYDWKYCEDMHVGETYEVHWPHSNMGACGTPNQYQSPFYDGVFCNFATTFESNITKAKIGVQAQVFTIVNDEDYYYPDLFSGMIVDGEMGADVAKYTGSTTGTSRNNEVCSQYTGITWQVDRKCHMVSASSFDKMCADMKSQRDDMAEDYYPHGSREVVDHELTANNQANRKLRGN